MTTRTTLLSVLLALGLPLGAAPAAAQAGFGATDAPPRPWARVSFFTIASRIQDDGGQRRAFGELATSLTYQLPEGPEDGFDYGLDVRYSAYTAQQRPERTSLYEAYVGARLADGRFALRLGQFWVNDLGSLGSIAGGLAEYRSPRAVPDAGRFRVGLFGGLEPNILDIGYAPDVKKLGAYVAYDGAASRRHALGYTLVHHGSLTERSVLTVTNFMPMGPKVFIYQAADYDVQSPAGRAHRGLAYLFANARVLAAERLDLQATYNRGRSIDARNLSEDLLQGRPVTASALEGLAYESAGGRATVEVVRTVRVYAGYARDKNNRDAESTGRTLIGGYASNIGNWGLDLTASDSLVSRPQGSYHSRYVSLGRQWGRHVYATGDYSTSLSVIRFSRSDGLIVETRPHTTRYSGTATITLPHAISLLVTVERSRGDDFRDLRLMTGITYRIR